MVLTAKFQKLIIYKLNPEMATHSMIIFIFLQIKSVERQPGGTDFSMSARPLSASVQSDRQKKLWFQAHAGPVSAQLIELTG